MLSRERMIESFEGPAALVSLSAVFRSVSSMVKRGAILAASVVSVGIGVAVFHLGVVNFGDNFHPVVQGELYRSAQPPPERIAAYQKEHGIKTIINLRGSNVGSAWYDDEVAEAMRLGIAHVDFRMSARRELTEQQFNDLIALLRTVEKPVLVHCTAGADRSGLVAALYLAAIAKRGEAEAESQISFWYGHIPFWFSAPYAMDRTFEAFEPVLGYPNS
jgi:protein tyrosine/serine phosphatase